MRAKRSSGVLLLWESVGRGISVPVDVVRLLREQGILIERVIYVVQSERSPVPTREDVGGAAVEPIVVKLPDDDPTQHQAIYDGVRRSVVPRLAELESPLHVNISSGTPAMHAVWLVLHAGGALPLGTTLWSGQLVKKSSTTRLDPVNFPIETYLAEIRRAAAAHPSEARYDPECRSPARRAALDRLARYARVSRAPLLVLGERGTGKTRLVETFVGPLKGRPKVVSVPCGTLDPDLAMSALFGHVQGAFTDAKREHAGYLEAAAGGVLFLDEVQDLVPRVQRQLVRLLQDPKRRFRRVGETAERAADVEIVCASHRPLAALRRQLDPDLFDRLSLLFVEIPPLRDCRADVRDDWERVWREARASEDIAARAPWTEAIERALSSDALPGNLRDLQRLALLLLAHGTTSSGTERALGEWAEMQGRVADAEQADGSGAVDDVLPDGSWDELVARYQGRLAAAARRKHGTFKKAAEILRVNERTLRAHAKAHAQEPRPGE